MPADRGAGGVFGDQRMRQLGRREPGEFGGPVAQWQQEIRQLGRLVHGHVVEIVAQPEGGDTALAEIAVKLEFAQLQLGKIFDDGRFLFRCHKILTVCEPVRQRGHRLQ